MVVRSELGSVAARSKKTLCVELRRPSLLEVFTPDVDGLVYPETYFKATCEMIILMLGGSVIITFLFNRPVIWDNPLNKRIGYPNLCVFFDTFPAKYYAVLCWGFVIFLGCRFAWLDIDRTILVRSRLSNFKIFVSIFTDVLFMLTVILFSFVFIVPPELGVWKHSGAFIVLIFVMYMVILANIMEAKEASWASWVWIIFYGILSMCDVIFICGNFIHYDRMIAQNPLHVGPLFPVPLGFIADYGWFCCTPLCTIFLPNAEGIRITKKIVEESELSYAERDETIGCCGGHLCEDEDGSSDDPDDQELQRS